jgi:hypothetical protein
LSVCAGSSQQGPDVLAFVLAVFEAADDDLEPSAFFARGAQRPSAVARHAALRVSVAFMRRKRRGSQRTAQFRNGARFFVSLILTYSNKINFFHLLNGEIAA